MVADQDMMDWFENLFGKEPSQMVPPQYGILATMRPEVVLEGIEPRSYSLRDIDHKSLYQQDNNLMLAFLQGDDNSAQEEILSVLPNRFLNRKKIPLILAINGGSQGISCGKEDEPKLQLEDTNLVDLFANEEEAKRFTFFKFYNGSTHTFESAAHPGWFLSSSDEAHSRLSLTSHLGGAAITDFYFYRE